MRAQARPGGRAFEERARRRALALVLLTEQVVADLVAPVLAEIVGVLGTQRGQRVVRARLDGGAFDLQHVGDLSVALALLEQELEDRALIGWELVEAGHAERESSGALPIGCRSKWISHSRWTRASTPCTASSSTRWATD